MKKSPKRHVVSLFSGALGLDLGLEQAGFNISVAVECDALALQTITRNRSDLPVISKKLEEVDTTELLERAGLKVGEAAVVTGGPSCQPFSTAGKRGSVEDPRGSMFNEFLRVVEEAKPEFFVMENVKGILSAAVKHRPLKERGPGYPPLEPEEELGSAMVLMVQNLKELGYHVVFDVMNSADYGVPQIRERVLFLGSRDGRPIRFPRPTHSMDGAGGKKKWVTLAEALEGLDEDCPDFTSLSCSKARYLKMVPEGGNWRDLPEEVQKEALGGAYTSWGGRTGFFRRLAWDQPPPSVTTRPDSKATMQCHPEELRPLSVREYARIQQFPDDWQFAGSIPRRYLQIGNAFPVGLGRILGKTLLKSSRRRPEPNLEGTLLTRGELLESLAEGNRTCLNPNRMRKIQGAEAAREWMKEAAPEAKRKEILQYVTPLNGTKHFQ